jgi:hypothetical protein
MQTMLVEIQDNYVQNFMSCVNDSESIRMERDPCFYERQNQLSKEVN